MYNYHNETMITQLLENQVFVFGSNLAGLHRGGAAKVAKDHFGALQGVGRGWSGQSFAIPTLNEHFQPMPLSQIAHYIDDFKIYTKNHPQQTYFITSIGCGGAGYQPQDIAPLFAGISDNVILPIRFRDYLEVQLENVPSLRKEVLSFYCRDTLIFADVTTQNDIIKNTKKLTPIEKVLVQKALAINSYTDKNMDRIINATEQLTDCFTFQSNSEGPLVFVSKILNLLDVYASDLDEFQSLWQHN